MGAILAKFRKKKTTEEILEDLDTKIQDLENYTINTQQQKRRFVGTFVAFSLGIYIIGFLIFYFIYLPETWKERLIYFTPLLIFPFLIVLLRRVFTWYFERKLNKNSGKLKALRVNKKKILEEVMDKETYKVAVNLLARFGDKSSSRLSLGTLASQPTTNRAPVQQKSLALQASQPRSSLGPTNNNNYSLLNASSSTHSLGSTSSPRPLSTTAIAVGTTPSLSTAVTPYVRPNQMLRRRTPFPIVSEQQKGVFERCVDLLIGDGPKDRFAMICKECHEHNGMAIKEEFFYTAFRCAFCGAFNAARKTRPVAPKLSLSLETGSAHSTPGSARKRHSSSTNSDSASGSEDESSRRVRHITQLRLSESTASAEANGSSEADTKSIDAMDEDLLEPSANINPPDHSDVEVEESEKPFDAELLNEQLNQANAEANAALLENVKEAFAHISSEIEKVNEELGNHAKHSGDDELS